MYTKVVPYKDFKGNPRNESVSFGLSEREVFKLLGELQTIFKWRESIQDQELREIPTEEVVAFYTSFEELLLNAYGELSEDGRYFRKAGRYEFEESALFNACMVLFVTHPEETTKLIDQIMPDGMEEIVKKADESLIEAGRLATDENDQAQLAKLRARLAELEAGDGSKTES